MHTVTGTRVLPNQEVLQQYLQTHIPENSNVNRRNLTNFVSFVFADIEVDEAKKSYYHFLLLNVSKQVILAEVEPEYLQKNNPKNIDELAKPHAEKIYNLFLILQQAFRNYA